MVQNIEAVGAEFDRLPFADGKLADQGDVQVPLARSGESVSPQISILAQSGQSEGRGVEPLARRGIGQRRVADKVGTLIALPRERLIDPARDIDGQPGEGRENSGELPPAGDLGEDTRPERRVTKIPG